MHDVEITKELAREFALEIFDSLMQAIQANALQSEEKKVAISKQNTDSKSKKGGGSLG